MNIYIGNLSPNTTEDELRHAFSGFGDVQSVSIITDKFSGESRGFAFVEMPDSAGASAVSGMNGQDLGGSVLKVNEAIKRDSGNRGGRSSNSGARRGW